MVDTVCTNLGTNENQSRQPTVSAANLGKMQDASNFKTAKQRNKDTLQKGKHWMAQLRLGLPWK